MSLTSLGDLSSSYSSRQRNVALRQQIDRLTAELATGQVTDVREVLAGNYSYLTDIERRSSILEGYSVATAEAGLYADAMQNALSVVNTFGSDLSFSLLTTGSSAVGVPGAVMVEDAKNALSGMLGALNTKAAGRYLFSGTATDRPPLEGLDAVLTGLRAAVSGAATPDDVLAAAQTWFDDPAGFTAAIYTGGDTAIAPFDLSQSEKVTLDIRAIDPKLLETLRLTAVAAIADDPALGFGAQFQAELFDKAGQGLLVAQDNIVALRADVGFVESRIDKVSARNAAEQTSLEFAKIALLEIDPFEAATRLEEAQFQLQSLYSVTVKMSQLSLVNFL